MKKLMPLFYFLFLLSCNNNNTQSTIEKGKIIINPYNITPLSAVYKINSVNTTPLTVTVKGLYGEPDITHTYPAGYGNEFEIHGMFPESYNTIIVDDGVNEITENTYIGPLNIYTKKLPSKFDVEINNLDEENSANPNMYFTSINIDFTNWVTLGISYNGYVRYYNNAILFAKIVPENNNILFYATENHNYSNGIYYLSGKNIVKFPTKKAHHDLTKNEENYIYLTDSIWGHQDKLLEVSKYGKIVRELNFGTLIKDIVYKNNDQNEIKNT